ncbi:uncharacterized protein LOC121260078 [Juglans microcarpa x Juglans regia]|uniref:uncharacterized protein LOC121260078 n=1 Tax=Juglans microcarpa x Juglans regia TaxID=2249226 RepID=UPI001B7ED684|nr:uncharacterized protein LOC121260078 [Juglans microcarpa x Juglans regia]
MKQGESSMKSGLEKCWKKLWKLEVPRNVKNFLWKACQGVLPTRLNLYKKQAVDSPIYMVCKKEAELEVHVLWRCVAANDIWNDAASLVQKWNVNEMDFLEFWIRCTETLNEVTLSWVAVMLRKIWLRRNNFLFEGRMIERKRLVLGTNELMEEYKTAQARKQEGQQGGTSTNNTRKWETPSEGYIKANWDAALHEDVKEMGIGVIVWDCEGEVLVSLLAKRSFNSKPVLAECLALYRAMVLCHELSLCNVIFEGDAQSVVKAVKSKEENWLWFGQVVDDIKELLKRRQDWKVAWVPREENGVAHQLAKFGFNYSNEIVMIEESPEFISGNVLFNKLYN